MRDDWNWRRDRIVEEYGERHDVTPARRSETAPPPDTGAVAAALGVDRGRLLQFVGVHPSPTPKRLIEWADAGEELEGRVEEWLTEYGTAAERWERTR